MYRATSSALWTLAWSAVVVAYGAREGVLVVKTRKIRDENARAIVEGALAVADAAIDAGADVVERAREVIERSGGR